jgi:hypothetical protein
MLDAEYVFQDTISRVYSQEAFRALLADTIRKHYAEPDALASLKEYLNTKSEDWLFDRLERLFEAQTSGWDDLSEKPGTGTESEQLLNNLVGLQSSDIARHAANKTLSVYDRGVDWASENFKIKGQQWKSAYLPVWLYSYQQKKGDNCILHYVAVNARTKETMGSVPIHMPKLVIISFLIEIMSIS